MPHPSAVQHAPWVLGHGSGLHGALAVNVEPYGQSDLDMNAHPPACPGMQHAPRGPPHGFGAQERFGVKCAPSEAHSSWVVAMQVLARLQHAPVGWQGARSHVEPETNVLAGGQFAAVVSMHTPVAALQHAPLGPQLAAAQVVFGNHAAAQSAFATYTQAVLAQHAPLETHGPAPHATPALQVPTHTAWVMLVQSPPAEQHDPASTGLGHGLEVQEPAK